MNKRYAILIASSKFPEEPGLTELRCPEHDVDALNELLVSPDFGQFAEVVVFKNRPSYEILPKLNSILSTVGQDDLVLVYYSGHGKLNRLGHLCLATSNTTFSSLEATSIPTAVIKSYFDLSDTRKRILILDCCYSGAAGAEFVKGGVDDQLQLMSGGQGTFIMTASTAFQTAVEKEGDSLGLFTKHLVEGIRSGEADKDEDGLISMHELYEYVHEKVRAEGAQVPMKWGLQTKGRMVITKSSRDAKEKRRQKLRAMLYKLAAEEWLSDGVVSAAKDVIVLPDNEMTVKDRESCLLIEQFVDDIENTAKTCHASEPPSVPPSRLKLLLFILIAASCVGWYFFSDWTDPKLPEKPRQNVCPQGSIITIGQYIDHCNGTITDAASGLMWKRCLEGLSGVHCEDGEIEKYIWHSGDMQHIQHIKYAGYSDWRLPTIDELKTLVHCSNGVKDKKSGRCNEGSKRPTINQQAFPNAEAEYSVWSISPFASLGDVWSVDFSSGNSDGDIRGHLHAVRLVRGGQ